MFAIVRKLDFSLVGQSPCSKSSEDLVYVEISEEQYLEFLKSPRSFRDYRAAVDGSGFKLVKVPKLTPDLASPIDLPRHLDSPSYMYDIYVSKTHLRFESNLDYAPPLTLVVTIGGDYETAKTLVLKPGNVTPNPFRVPVHKLRLCLVSSVRAASYNVYLL